MREENGKELKVRCVRTGDRFPDHYITRLESMVRRHLQEIPFGFEVVSDQELDWVFCRPTPYPGWWGKMSLYEEPGPLLYLDLDTIVLGDLEPLARAVLDDGSERGTLFLLGHFSNPEKEHVKGWQTGMIAWSGDWSWVGRAFDERRDTRKHNRHGDQGFVSDLLKRQKGGSHRVRTIQEVLPGVYSYKYHIRAGGGRLPEDVRVVCFHGYPKQHEVHDEWVKEHWR